MYMTLVMAVPQFPSSLFRLPSSPKLCYYNVWDQEGKTKTVAVPKASFCMRLLVFDRGATGFFLSVLRPFEPLSFSPILRLSSLS